jgi:hypothetical protein
LVSHGERQQNVTEQLQGVGKAVRTLWTQRQDILLWLALSIMSDVCIGFACIASVINYTGNVMNENVPPRQTRPRVNKNVLLGSLTLVILMFVVSLVYALFFSPEDSKPQELGTSSLSPRAAPTTTPTSK